MIRRGVVIPILLAATTSSVLAATLQVPSDFSTIQAAVDASVAGDSILVAPGQYNEVHGVTLFGKELSILGAGRDATSVTSEVRCFEIREDSDIKLSGLDVMSLGNAASGIVMSHARLELEGCRIHDSDGGLAGGGALRAAAGSEVVCRDVEFLRNTGVTGAVSVTSGSQRAYFDGCLFRDNETRLVLNDAGALEVAASVTELVDCVFYRNRSIAGSVGTVGAVHYYGSDGGSLLIDNCLIVANEGEHHGAILAEFGGEVTIRNSTIASNVGQTASGLTHIAPTVTTIENCIFASNGPGPALLCGLAGAGPITVTCSDIWGNGEGPECVGGSNIFLDPRFCGIDRWELLADSPCAPSVNPACGLIGAREVACLTHVQSMSWGKLKSLMLDK